MEGWKTTHYSIPSIYDQFLSFYYLISMETPYSVDLTVDLTVHLTAHHESGSLIYKTVVCNFKSRINYNDSSLHVINYNESSLHVINYNDVNVFGYNHFLHHTLALTHLQESLQRRTAFSRGVLSKSANNQSHFSCTK